MTGAGDDLRKIVGSAHAVLFDFDGPVCAVFAGDPAKPIAARLLELLPGAAPDVDASDPLEVLRYSARFGPAVVAEVEEALVAAEIRAVRTAQPTVGGAESIRRCVASGRVAAIVSNNSAGAVAEYLQLHRLDELVRVVSGREYARPDRMKPSAEPIRLALESLGLAPSAALMVGDSPSDVEAAQSAGVVVLGFANKPEKWDRLAGADFVIGDMSLLARALDVSSVSSASGA